MVNTELLPMKTIVFELLFKYLLKFCTLEIYDIKFDEFVAKILQSIIVKLGLINIKNENIDVDSFRLMREKLNVAVLSNVSLASKLTND